MVPERYIDLVNKLAQRTDNNEVNWKSTAHGKTFVVDFKQSSLSIRSYYDDRDQRDCVLFEILNSEGIAADDFCVGDGDAEWGVAHRLYSEALRKARNIDLVISDMTEQLESDASVGEEDITSESKD